MADTGGPVPRAGLGSPVMSAAVLVLIGLALCFVGPLSVRITVVVAGFATGWLLCEAVGTEAGTALLVSLASAAAAFVLTLVMAKVVLFVAGAAIGSVVGARVFVLATRGDAGSDWLLALVFVPSIALVLGFVAERSERAVLTWGTALAGASLVLAGAGRIGRDETEPLWRPDSVASSVVVAVLWVGLTLIGRRAQRSLPDRR